MIYAKATGQDVWFWIPKVYLDDVDSASFSLEAVGTVTRQRIVFDNLSVDKSSYDGYFKVTTVVPTDAEMGEYNYVFKDHSGKVVSSGVLIIFSGTPPVSRTSANNSKQYMQYGNQQEQ